MVHRGLYEWDECENLQQWKFHSHYIAWWKKNEEKKKNWCHNRERRKGTQVPYSSQIPIHFKQKQLHLSQQSLSYQRENIVKVYCSKWLLSPLFRSRHNPQCLIPQYEGNTDSSISDLSFCTMTLIGNVVGIRDTYPISNHCLCLPVGTG